MITLSLVDRLRDQVQVTDRVTEVLNVGPTTAEIVSLRQGSQMSVLGWRFFQSTTPTTLVQAGSRAQLPIDGRGMQANSYGVNSSQWLNKDTARFFPDKEGDFFFYRLNLSVNPTVNNRGVLIDFDIGAPNKVFNSRQNITSGAGNPVPMSFDVPSGGSARMLANGGAFYITPEVDVYVSQISVLAFKAFSVLE